MLSLNIFTFWIFSTLTGSFEVEPSLPQSALRSSKKGLVVPHWPVVRCGDFEAFNSVSWWYNYHTFPEIYLEKPGWCSCDGKRPDDPSVCLPADPQVVQFFPMVHGLPGHGNRPDEEVPDVKGQYGTVMGYNEPNQADKADLTPAEAAAGWIELQEKYPNKTLVSPACSGINVAWMDEFMQICEELGCRIDYIATHTYPQDNVEQIMTKLKDYSDRYGGRKIWLTEFARRNTHKEADVISMIEQLLPRLESADFIWRYSWWVTRYYPDPSDESGNFWVDPVNSLLEFDNATLTAVGRAYNNPWHLAHLAPTNL